MNWEAKLHGGPGAQTCNTSVSMAARGSGIGRVGMGKETDGN